MLGIILCGALIVALLVVASSEKAESIVELTQEREPDA